MSYQKMFLNVATPLFVAALLLLVLAGFNWNHNQLASDCFVVSAILCIISIAFFRSGFATLNSLLPLPTRARSPRRR